MTNISSASIVRRIAGLMLIGIGLALPLIYFGQQSRSSSIILTSRPTAIVERLVPTALPRTPTSIVLETITPTTASPTDQPTTTPTDQPTATAHPITPSDALTVQPRNTVVLITPLPRPTRTAASTRVPPTSTPIDIPAPAATAIDTPVPLATAIATVAPPPNPIGLPYSTRQRMCVGVAFPEKMYGNLQKVGVGWYLDWARSAKPYRPGGIEYAQMVRVRRGQPVPDLETIADIARQMPGSLWLIGNEMDVIWQDNSTPEQYATAYHDVYAAMKQADPASRVAIGGVSQPTPLRLQYLDRVLAAYRNEYGGDMPIDVWNVHNFILQEKHGDWGVDIPPGIAADSGQLYSIDDDDNLAIFKQQIVDFRRWMAARGYRDKELLVTEYGVLMPADYGFDYARVRTFMLGSFDYFLTAADGSIGMPADGNRLVQRWCWYSLSDNVYPTSNLMDFETGAITPLGKDFAAYIQSH